MSDEPSWAHPQPVRTASTGKQLVALLIGLVVIFAVAAAIAFAVFIPARFAAKSIAEVQPPAPLTASARRLAAEAGGIDGVVTASAKVEPVDLKDHPGEWYTSLQVTASSAADIGTVPAALSPLLAGTSDDIRVALKVPAGRGVAESWLSDVGPATVQAAEALRALPGVIEVSAGQPSYVTVQMDASRGLTDAVTELRPVLAQHTSTIQNLAVLYPSSRHHNVDLIISASWPSPQLLAALNGLSAKETTTSLSTSPPAPGSSSWFIQLTTSKPQDAQRLLESVADDGHEHPTRFDIDGFDDVSGEYRGTVGSAAQPSG